jgi:hypothetical protein
MAARRILAAPRDPEGNFYGEFARDSPKMSKGAPHDQMVRR